MKLKMVVIVGLLSLSATVVKANYICAGNDAQGNCIRWIDTGHGGYVSNYPGAQNNPTNPGSSCICIAHADNGSCSQYGGVNCSK